MTLKQDLFKEVNIVGGIVITSRVAKGFRSEQSYVPYSACLYLREFTNALRSIATLRLMGRGPLMSNEPHHSV